MNRTVMKVKRKKITAWSLFALLIASTAFIVITSMWILNTGTIIEGTRDGFLRNRASFALVMAVLSFITASIGTKLAFKHNHLNMEIYFALFSMAALVVAFVFPLNDMHNFRNNMSVRHAYMSAFPPLDHPRDVNKALIAIAGPGGKNLPITKDIETFLDKDWDSIMQQFASDNLVRIKDFGVWFRPKLQPFLNDLNDMVNNPVVILQEKMFVVNIAIFSTTMVFVMTIFGYVLFKYRKLT